MHYAEAGFLFIDPIFLGIVNLMRTETKQSLYRPLAARMRPKSLEDFVGHTDVLGEGSALKQAIENAKTGSLILWGPPGTGKTTLAEIIAHYQQAAIERLSAVSAGIKDIREVLGRAREWRKIGRPTVLIIDEIHRFNKAQQDVLLPAVEEGDVTLIGATTENPYFEVIPALVSRVQIVRLQKHNDEGIQNLIIRATQDKENGLGWKTKLPAKSLSAIVRLSAGDARRALNILERLGEAHTEAKQVKESDVEQAAQQAVIAYDKAGEIHYDVISAFIKSLRGSDPDAALFYLFRMIAGGEDPKFIVRRMFIFASEDIGNADPHALMLVDAAGRALEWVGLPEAEYNLAHAAVYLAAAPKSNSVTIAMNKAKTDVESHGGDMPPDHVVNAPIEGMKTHGKGVGYKYPHEFPGALVQQDYRPKTVQKHIYYEPNDRGFEKEVKRRVEEARKILRGK